MGLETDSFLGAVAVSLYLIGKTPISPYGFIIRDKEYLFLLFIIAGISAVCFINDFYKKYNYSFWRNLFTLLGVALAVAVLIFIAK